MFETNTSPYYAAIDLGSNSFHLIIVKDTDSGIQALDKVKHMVRLGEGLQADGYLSDDAFARGMTALKQMRQVIDHIPTEQVRAVGTNTLRIAKNGEAFIREGEAALGVPIDIISGVEEARLIYIGVTRHNHYNNHNLVIDVGGGSTEIIAGDGIEPVILRSLRMGCANMSLSFFPKGKLTKQAIDQAKAYVGQLIEPNIQALQAFDWKRVILSSGTAKNIGRLLEKLAPEEAGITPKGLNILLDKLIDIGKSNKLSKKLGIDEERAFGFPGGVCIIAALFEYLSIEKAVISHESLREGVLLDLMGRSDGHSDERIRTVKAFQNRFTIDKDHAQQVSELAQAINRQLPLMTPPRLGPMLDFAAQLHEIGLAISRSSHYNHGAYILDNADMPGFSTLLEHAIALIVKAQRKKFPQEAIANLPPEIQPYVWQAAIALRLSVVLYRSRTPIAASDFPLVSQQGQNIHLQFNASYLAKRPLTKADLIDEQTYWTTTSPYTLTFDVLP